MSTLSLFRILLGGSFVSANRPTHLDVQEDPMSGDPGNETALAETVGRSGPVSVCIDRSIDIDVIGMMWKATLVVQ